MGRTVEDRAIMQVLLYKEKKDQLSKLCMEMSTIMHILAGGKVASPNRDTCIGMIKCSCHLSTPWSIKHAGYIYVRQRATVEFVRGEEKPPTTNGLGMGHDSVASQSLWRTLTTIRITGS